MTDLSTIEAQLIEVAPRLYRPRYGMKAAWISDEMKADYKRVLEILASESAYATELTHKLVSEAKAENKNVSYENVANLLSVLSPELRRLMLAHDVIEEDVRTAFHYTAYSEAS